MSARRAGLRGALCAALALVLAQHAARGATAEESRPLPLRYGWSPGQVWRATSSVERETRVGDDVQRDRGAARFEYTVERAPGGEVRLEARMLAQETDAGATPIDFSPIAFHAEIDARGRLRDAHYTIADAPPPAAAGEVSDPVAYQQILRRVASAWRSAVFWFPELPERSLKPGDAFVVEDERDLSDEPGAAMRVHSTRTYRLLAVADGVARFRVEEDSRVDAGSGESRIDSRERAEGEALFDLALGMWTRQQLVSSQRARYSGPAEGKSGAAGEASSRSVATIEMERAPAAGAPPR